MFAHTNYTTKRNWQIFSKNLLNHFTLNKLPHLRNNSNSDLERVQNLNLDDNIVEIIESELETVENIPYTKQFEFLAFLLDNFLK